MLGRDVVLGGRYRILGELGRGGMGVVYRARDQELQREVAIKLVEGQLSPTRLARLQREAELTASLNHPGVVRLHGLGDLEARPYLVYELVEGARELDRAFAGADLRQRVAWVQAAAAGVGAAHAQGVVHRDVKPANILVDAQGRARVTDFGLARGAGQSRLTRTGAMAGTPTHMAPEQLDPRAKVGPPADVWALGVVLYQALTGALPFDGETWQRLVSAIVDDDPPAPSAVADVPTDLSAVCLRALAKRPVERYPDAGALAADLERWLTGQPVQGGPARRRWPALLLLAAPVVAAAVAAWLAPAGSRPPASDAPAASPQGSSPASPPPLPTDAAGDLRATLRLDDRWARTLGAVAWLRQHPDHPAAANARSAIAATYGEPLLTLRHETRRRVDVCWTGPRELATSASSGLRLWSLDPVPTPLATHALAPGALPLAVSATRRLYTATPDGLWALDLSQPERPPTRVGPLPGPTEVKELALLDLPGRTWIAASGEGGAGLWQIGPAGLSERVAFYEAPEQTVSVALWPNPPRLYVGTFHNAASGADLLELDLQGTPPRFVQRVACAAATSLACTPGGVVLGAKGGQLSLTPFGESSLRHFYADGGGVFLAHAGSINNAVWREGRLYTSAKYGALGVWSLDSSEPLRPHRRLGAELAHMDVSPDAAFLALGMEQGGDVRIYVAGAVFW